MSEPSVLFEIVEGVAVATLNEGERMNPLTESLQAGLLEAIERVREDRSIRALLLTARGRGFCTGADLKDFSRRAAEMGRGDSLGAYVGRLMEETGNPILYGLRTLPVPGALRRVPGRRSACTSTRALVVAPASVAEVASSTRAAKGKAAIHSRL